MSPSQPGTAGSPLLRGRARELGKIQKYVCKSTQMILLLYICVHTQIRNQIDDQRPVHVFLGERCSETDHVIHKALLNIWLMVKPPHQDIYQVNIN